MPYGITQCYLPPGTGDIPTFTPAKLVLDLRPGRDASLRLNLVDSRRDNTAIVF